MSKKKKNSIKGKVIKVLGKDISTDEIYPGTYLYCTDFNETPKFCFKNDEEFNQALASGKIPPGSIIVAGSNFGCGSSREQAASALAGYDLTIIAKSFARIFYKNAANLGIKIIIVPEVDALEGDEFTIFITETTDEDGRPIRIAHKIRNERTGKIFSVTLHDPDIQFLIDNGGLARHIAELLKDELSKSEEAE